MSFAGMVNNYPWVNGGALFNTSASWTQITYNEVGAVQKTQMFPLLP
jgi:hypothetical protein